MSWHKVVFNDDQIIGHEALNFRNRVSEIFFASKAPEEFCLFSELTVGNERTISNMYLSPVASQYCRELIAAHGGVSCDKPKVSEDLSFAAGDPNCWERLRAMS
jgi:hypothetical protein